MKRQGMLFAHRRKHQPAFPSGKEYPCMLYRVSLTCCKVARTILTALENGSIDPDRTGGVSYGDRSMKRSSQHFQTESSSKCSGSCF